MGAAYWSIAVILYLEIFGILKLIGFLINTTCHCLNILTSIGASEIIDILGIVINSALAIWIVKTIQNRLTNKRVLKDHFIGEVKGIRDDYRVWLNNVYSNNIHPKRVLPWFKLMNIKIDDLMDLINSKYRVDKQSLRPYQIDLRELITNNEDFINQFEADRPVSFSEASRTSFVKFQQDNNKLFNKLIISINDAG